MNMKKIINTQQILHLKKNKTLETALEKDEGTN